MPPSLWCLSFCQTWCQVRVCFFVFVYVCVRLYVCACVCGGATSARPPACGVPLFARLGARYVCVYLYVCVWVRACVCENGCLSICQTWCRVRVHL